MVWVVPDSHTSPPLGEMIETEAAGGGTIENTTFVVSVGLPSVSLILTRHWVETELGMVQGY